MGYFSNSSEGMGFMECYCIRCVNWRDNGSGTEGCPIMDLHSLWNYDAVGKSADVVKKEALSHFIPLSGKGENEECKMFQIRPAPTQAELERLGQRRLL